jgi:hypothetical protein
MNLQRPWKAASVLEKIRGRRPQHTVFVLDFHDTDPSEAIYRRYLRFDGVYSIQPLFYPTLPVDVRTE